MKKTGLVLVVLVALLAGMFLISTAAWAQGSKETIVMDAATFDPNVFIGNWAYASSSGKDANLVLDKKPTSCADKFFLGIGGPIHTITLQNVTEYNFQEGVLSSDAQHQSPIVNMFLTIYQSLDGKYYLDIRDDQFAFGQSSCSYHITGGLLFFGSGKKKDHLNVVLTKTCGTWVDAGWGFLMMPDDVCTEQGVLTRY